MTAETLPELLRRLRLLRYDLDRGVALLEAIEATELHDEDCAIDRQRVAIRPVGIAARAAKDALDLLRVWHLDPIATRAATKAERRAHPGATLVRYYHDTEIRWMEEP
jgi:hypothetical protein